MRLLLISGSTRSGSTNTATLRTAQTESADSVETELYSGLSELPAFNPDDDRDPLPEAVENLRKIVDYADAVLVCTPEYAGGLPGSFKNLLDWLVGSVALSDKPIAWINVASVAAPAGGEGAHQGLRTVLGYVSARIVEPACVRLPLSRSDIGEDGLISDRSVRSRIAESVAALVDAAG